MRELTDKFVAAMRRLWLGLRQWSGDAAYETYLASARRGKCSCEKRVLSAEEFYLEQLQRKYSRPNRCC